MSSVICKFLRCQKPSNISAFIRRAISSQPKHTEENVEEVKIPVPWGHIAGKWWGNKSSPPILAIHGWQDNANSFDKLIPLLNVRSVLAIDLPGHGHSSHLPEGNVYDFAEFIIMMQRIKKYYNWTKLPLITHSFGGALGYVYSSLFPNDIEWHVNIECARTLLTLGRRDLANKMSREIDDFLKIERQKKDESPPVYKLSQMIQMCIEGSLGSITTPEAALVLLERGITLASDIPKNSPNADKSENKFSGSDLADFIKYEKQGAMSLPEAEQQSLLKRYLKMIEAFEKVKAEAKKFKLSEKEDKHYVFTRDPSIKILVFQTISEDFVMEASKSIKCPVLSIRAKGGFLYGSTRKLYENTLEILSQNCAYLEHHDLNGTHHVHLNSPETLAPIINAFIQKYESV